MQGLPDTVVIDSSPRMLVVEADPEVLHELVEHLTDWVAGLDQSYPVPDARHRVERPPE